VLRISLAAWVVGNTSGVVGFLVSACDAVVSHNGINNCNWGWPLVTSLVEVVMLWVGVLVGCSVWVVSRIRCKRLLLPPCTTTQRPRKVVYLSQVRAKRTPKVCVPVQPRVPLWHDPKVGGGRAETEEAPPPPYAVAVGSGAAQGQAGGNCGEQRVLAV